jgi:hypothetical protein
VRYSVAPLSGASERRLSGEIIGISKSAIPTTSPCMHPAQRVAFRYFVFVSELSAPTSESAQVYVQDLILKTSGYIARQRSSTTMYGLLRCKRLCLCTCERTARISTYGDVTS